MNLAVSGSVTKPRYIWLPTTRTFLYFIVVLIYIHAICYPLLEQYLPYGEGKFLTLIITSLIAVASSIVLVKILLKGIVPGGWSIALLLLYVLNATFSVVNMAVYFGTVDLSQFAIGFYRTPLPIFLCVVAYVSVHSINQVDRITKTIAFLNTLIAGIGVITYLLGESWVGFLRQLPHMETLPLHYGGVLRMTSVLWNPLTFGVLMALNGILTWVFIYRKFTWFWYLSFILSAIGTIASFTRTAWMILLVGVTVTFLLTLRRQGRRLPAIVVTSLLVAGVIINIPLPVGRYADMVEAVLGHIEATFTERARMEDLRVNIGRIAVNPIGYGLGTAGYSALPTRGLNSPVVFTKYVAADNNYLSMVLQVGIQGIFLFLAAQGIILRKLIKSRRRFKDSLARAVLDTGVGWIAGMMVGAFFLNVWEYNLVPYVVYTLLGMALKTTALPDKEINARLEDRI